MLTEQSGFMLIPLGWHMKGMTTCVKCAGLNGLVRNMKYLLITIIYSNLNVRGRGQRERGGVVAKGEMGTDVTENCKT